MTELPVMARTSGSHVTVLVEHPDGAVRAVLTKHLESAGYAVATCSGPDVEGAAPGCPLLQHGGSCPAVDAADVVVSGLSPHAIWNRIILRRARAQNPDRPVILTAPCQLSVEDIDELADAHVHPLDRTTVMAAVATLTEPTR